MTRNQYKCVCFSISFLHIRIQYTPHVRTAPTRWHLPALLVPYPSTSRVKNTPLPLLTLLAFPHSTSFPSRRLLILHCHHPRDAERARATHGTRPCTIPPARRAKSACATIKQRPCRRDRRSSGKGKECAGEHLRLECADVSPVECVREQLVRTWQHKHESEGEEEAGDDDEDEEEGG